MASMALSTRLLPDTIFWGNVSSTNVGHLAYHNGGSFSLTDAIIQNDGDADLFDAPLFGPTWATLTPGGYLSDNDPNFVDAASGDIPHSTLI